MLFPYVFVFFNPAPMPMTLEVSSELEELATQGPARASKGPLNMFRLDDFDGLRVFQSLVLNGIWWLC